MNAAGLFTVTAIRAAEARLQQGLEPGELMARAARAVADEAGWMLRQLPAPAHVCLLVGPGNNGGDALLVGSMLAANGHRVEAFGVASIRLQAPAAADAARAWSRWQPRPIAGLTDLATAIERFGARFDGLSPADESGIARPAAAAGWLIVDGLFGIGLTRPLGPDLAALFASLRRLRLRRPGLVRLLAIDVPSGLDADRGAAAGGPGAALLAVDATVTMIADKPGLRTGAGLEAAGRVRVATLRPSGVPPVTEPPAAGHRIDATAARDWIPRRHADSHKGRHGDVLIVGGRLAMHGAARLAARGALAAGAGKVSIATAAQRATARRQTPDDGEETPADATRPEIMRWAWGPAGLGRFDAVVAGCGLGTDATARRWLQAVLNVPVALILDADALTLVAGDATLARLLRRRADRHWPTALTPHPLEAARLLDSNAVAIQGDRITAATRLATRLAAIVVLKGAGTIVADPGGHWAINASGGPVLATAGTGDVLAGIIGALAAQLPIATAACLGTWAHGAAGDAQARAAGDTGSPAAVIADRLPLIWRSADTAPDPDDTEESS